MKIGELSTASGTPVETIRFYERESLLPAPERTESNYRVYTQVHADRLGFIRQCRNLDMTLDEVRVLLRFRDAPRRTAAKWTACSTSISDTSHNGFANCTSSNENCVPCARSAEHRMRLRAAAS